MNGVSGAARGDSAVCRALTNAAKDYCTYRRCAIHSQISCSSTALRALRSATASGFNLCPSAQRTRGNDRWNSVHVATRGGAAYPALLDGGRLVRHVLVLDDARERHVRARVVHDHRLLGLRKLLSAYQLLLRAQPPVGLPHCRPTAEQRQHCTACRHYTVKDSDRPTELLTAECIAHGSLWLPGRTLPAARAQTPLRSAATGTYL